MPEAPIALLIPPDLPPLAPARSLPTTPLPPKPGTTALFPKLGPTRIGVAAIDASGRVREKTLLREIDLDSEWDLIRLEEKRDAVRWQPVSPSLMQALLQHRAERGSGQPTTKPLLRYLDATPLTTRRYDHLWKRVGDRLPWVAAQGISTHWLRHTTLTWVERRYGYGVARAYGGHLDGRGPATTTYIRATLHKIAIALSGLTGEEHPCSRQPSSGTLPPHWPWTTPQS